MIERINVLRRCSAVYDVNVYQCEERDQSGMHINVDMVCRAIFGVDNRNGTLPAHHVVNTSVISEISILQLASPW